MQMRNFLVALAGTLVVLGGCMSEDPASATDADEQASLMPDDAEQPIDKAAPADDAEPSIASLTVHNAATATTNPDQKSGRGILTVEQLNMCMWGSTFTRDCFPNSVNASQNPSAWTAMEESVASAKRESIKTQIRRHNPDIITINEGCLNDLTQVAADTGYKIVSYETGRGRKCTVNRGISVNAILSRIVDSAGPHGYMSADSFRSFVCAHVHTANFPTSVQICTAHLSLQSQVPYQSDCDKLTNVLNQGSTTAFSLFAGDVNRGRSDPSNCAPSRFHGLKDRLYSGTSATDGLQHIYYSANGLWRGSCGWAYDVENTDHKGFLLELSDHSLGIGGCGSREI
jgi:hypothetical protein